MAFKVNKLSSWLRVVHRKNDPGPSVAGCYNRRPQTGQNAYSAGKFFRQKPQAFVASTPGAGADSDSRTGISQRSQMSIGSPVFTFNTGMKKTLR